MGNEITEQLIRVDCSSNTFFFKQTEKNAVQQYSSTASTIAATRALSLIAAAGLLPILPLSNTLMSAEETG